MQPCFLHLSLLHAAPPPGCSVDRNKYQIQIPLPPKIDPSVTMMTVEEKPDITYRLVMAWSARVALRASVSFGPAVLCVYGVLSCHY
jgi:hypothetical protein